MYDPNQTQPIPPLGSQPVPYGGPVPPAQAAYGAAPPAQPGPYGGMPVAPAPQAPPPGVYPQAAPLYPQPALPAYGGYPMAYAPAYPVYPAAPAFAPPQPEKNPRRKAASRQMNRLALLCFAQIALSAGCGYVFTLLFLVLGIDLFAPDGYAMSMMTSVSLVFSTGLVPFLFFVAGRRKTVDYLKFQKVGFFPGLLCVLAGTAIMLLANIPAALVQQALEGVGYESVSVETSESAGTWLGFLIDFGTIALLGPMLEEIMDRGIFVTALRPYGLGFAAVGSGLLFGLNHLDISTVVFAIIAGIVLGFLYARTNNLWLTIWIHILNNGFAIITRYAGLFYPQDPDLFAGVLEIALLALGGLSLLLLLTWKRKVFITRRSPQYDGPAQSFTVGQSLGALAGSPMMWVFLGVVGAYFALLVL